MFRGGRSLVDRLAYALWLGLIGAGLTHCGLLFDQAWPEGQLEGGGEVASGLSSTPGTPLDPAATDAPLQENEAGPITRALFDARVRLSVATPGQAEALSGFWVPLRLDALELELAGDWRERVFALTDVRSPTQALPLDRDGCSANSAHCIAWVSVAELPSSGPLELWLWAEPLALEGAEALDPASLEATAQPQALTLHGPDASPGAEAFADSVTQVWDTAGKRALDARGEHIRTHDEACIFGPCFSLGINAEGAIVPDSTHAVASPLTADERLTSGACSLWLRPEARTHWTRIFAVDGPYGSQGSNRFWAGLSQPSGGERLAFGSYLLDSNDSAIYREVRSEAPYALDAWQHVGITWDLRAGGFVRFYINGVRSDFAADYAEPWDARASPANLPIWLFNLPETWDRPLTGQVDEFRWYAGARSDSWFEAEHFYGTETAILTAILTERFR